MNGTVWSALLFFLVVLSLVVGSFAAPILGEIGAVLGPVGGLLCCGGGGMFSLVILVKVLEGRDTIDEF